ncbi:unnamed protein product [Medioppia subpectinata]|uniref:Uncharacterized protein n=1 Tax=Medioppia subpectinata TaxID=1979941 RepID=A0A7R9L219_9ACAR|nr:unnamed protein product [Medioppia subpectinata]CAG2113787.1 unnamed protein product [Medioppia subpectinata]
MIRKVKRRQRPHDETDESLESMVLSNPSVADIDMNGRQRERNISLSEDSLALRQSFFSSQAVRPIIEDEDKIRESIISNNEVPPTYDEAKQLPNS